MKSGDRPLPWAEGGAVVVKIPTSSPVSSPAHADAKAAPKKHVR